MALSARTWPSPSLGGGSHQELPVGGQQPRSVGLHFSILFAQPKLHGDPVQLMGSAGDAAISTADLLTKAPAPRPPPSPGRAEPSSGAVGGWSWREKRRPQSAQEGPA